MGDNGCDEPEVRGKVALYVVGQISGSERWTVEEHLARCPECLDESRILGDAVLALTFLGDADRQELIAEFGVPAGVATAPVAARTATTSGPPARVDADRRPAPRAPGTTRPGSRPRRPLRRGPVMVAGGLVLVVLLAVGGVLGQAALFGPPSPAPTALVADSGGSASGAVLSVTVSAGGGDSAVRATVSGLEPNRSYRFYVTDVDGNSYDMAGVTGTEQAQDLTTACPVPMDRVDRFSVTAPDGALVVAAVVRRDTDAPSPPG
ncbi:zf-HC2 domain-containing protein [Micromonospora sp. NPDC005979]|uniref:zf-HC2 domain-containing protein n=2 Tax=unclassified Micromonospora TaxID=2617518 RepID=UPI0033B79E7C